ncbi:MAG: S1 RNA-binding domain-containing protein [Polyangiaceae bacterium]|nr:S1 RNA-binding domain-containing protein [Polyangiaceae bacterium]
MSTKDDFASLMEAAGDAATARSARQLRVGEQVEGVVLQIGADRVFLDVGAARDASIDRGELVDKSGMLTVSVGDRLRATVVSTGGEEGLKLSVAMGRQGSLDVQTLTLALESGAPVSGEVAAAVKAGLEVDLGGVRAFCPASQVEAGFAADLSPYVGQTLEFKVLEVKEGGRRVVVSRRALLLERREQRALELEAELTPGKDIEGQVTSLQKYGALVDLGGVEGMIHVSELAHGRVDRVEDVVQVGERVTVRVLGVERDRRGELRVRLSLRALVERPAASTPERDEVLEGTVTRTSSFGVFVATPKGEGLVPLRDLALAPGADHRKAFPADKPLQVVVAGVDPKSGRLRLSVSGVDRVIERSNFKSYREGAASGGGGLGSLGDVLRAKLGLPAEAPSAPAPSAPAPVQAPAASTPTHPSSAPSPTHPSSAPAPAAAPPAPVKAAPAPVVTQAAPQKDRPPIRHDGVVRRRRP